MARADIPGEPGVIASRDDWDCVGNGNRPIVMKLKVNSFCSQLRSQASEHALDDSLTSVHNYPVEIKCNVFDHQLI